MTDRLWYRVPLKMWRVNKNILLPQYAKPGDSGMDVATPVDLELQPGVPVFFDAGFAVAIPEGWEGHIRSRSGLTKHKGITACSGVGTIDSGYRNTIGVTLLWNARWDTVDGWEPVRFKAGDRVAQLVILPVAHALIQEVESLEELGATERGATGFGSTGL